MGRGADETIMSDRTDETIATRVRDLIQQGYEQTSRKYRTLARLPEGMTGMEALRSVDPKAFERLMERFELDAADTYRRMHSERQGHMVTLTIEEFSEFRKQLDASYTYTPVLDARSNHPASYDLQGLMPTRKS